jgi:hypothetical protein
VNRFFSFLTVGTYHVLLQLMTNISEGNYISVSGWVTE